MRAIVLMALTLLFVCLPLTAQTPQDPEGPTSVTLTSQLPIYFKGDDNQRERKFKAMLPTDLDRYAKVQLDIKLSCPADKCDAWDRMGSFGIISQAPESKGQYLELMRFMTPYGLGEEWSLDVTDFLPLLQGEQTFQVFIDTWVGPGHPQGNGWLVDATLHYLAGKAQEKTTLIVPILSFAEIIYGDPERSTARSKSIPSLLGFKSAKFVSTISGHGQGNAQNCAEFCAKTHSISINNHSFTRRVWRDDCSTTVNPEQKGSWFYPRAGWCPGDKVAPWIEDISAALLSENLSFTYDVESFENTCRPDSQNCSGCIFGTGCDYDGAAHTEPRYMVSAYVIYKN